jgi:hypothetical protein
MPTSAKCTCSAFPIPVALALVIAAALYLRGWYRLRSGFPGLMPGWRVAAFMGGLVSIWIAVGSPLARLDHELLTIHMVKHLLLMALGAPMVLLGVPALPLVHGFGLDCPVSGSAGAQAISCEPCILLAGRHGRLDRMASSGRVRTWVALPRMA